MFSSNTSAVSADANYIEDVFSTWLYTGTGATQTINNGIDLAAKGGLVWTKLRSIDFPHGLWDTNRGTTSRLITNTTGAQQTFDASVFTSFNSNGFTVGSDAIANYTTYPYASWTFRKQPKFFDVVTWTGNGTGTRAISHSLASTPGCIILKRTDSADDWWVVHRSASNFGNYAVLNTTAAFTNSINSGISSVGSTSFTVSAYYNSSGATWVAYIFGHDAGGFGLTGTDNVISCGSYTGTGAAGNTITLGYEPQWVLIKRRDAASSWNLADTMRGMPADGFNNRVLYPNLSNAENNLTGIGPTATGFTITSTDSDYNGGGASYIYIAIRRGPMKTPTSGASVFYPQQPFGQATITGGFVADTMWARRSTSNSDNTGIANRLTGQTYMASSQNYAEGSDSTISFASNTATIWGNFAGGVRYNWARAPGFYDVVCYTGTNSLRAQAHNLSVAPEWIIAVSRNPGSNWQVFYSFGVSTFSRINLNTNAAASTGISYGTQLTSAPTASNINLGASFPNSVEPIVMYLFASLPGVSKVGSYTGTGAAQTINCGFTGGARFIMIKRTDSTGDWYVYDSARGISSGNDSYFLMNSVAAFDTSTDYVDTASSGFQLTSSAPAALNANGGTYIFLAIA